MQTFSARTVHVMVISAFAALTLVGCSKKAADGSTGDSVAAHADTAASRPATGATPNTANAAPTAASLGADDIDRWQRGMDAELKAVQDAGTQLKNAKNSTDSLNAVFAANETSTRAAGATAAGIDEQRYQLIANTLATLAADMSPLEQEMDVSKMPASTVESMKHAREQSLASASAGLSPALMEAMRPRAAALRKQALTLAGERLKASGMTT